MCATVKVSVWKSTELQWWLLHTNMLMLLNQNSNYENWAYHLLVWLLSIPVFGGPTAPRAFELLARFKRSQFGTDLRQCACISDSAAPSLSFSITPFIPSIFPLSWMGRCWLAKTNHMTIQPPCSRKYTFLVAWTLILATWLLHTDI